MSDPAPRPNTARDGMLPPQRVKWGLPDAAVGLALFVAIIVGSGLLGRAPWFPHSDALATAITLAFYVILVGYAVAVARRRGLGGLVRDFGLELKWVDLAIGVGLAIALRIIDVFVYDFAIGVLRLPKLPTSNIELPKNFVWAVIYGLGIASLIAPIVEELFFRGLLMRAIRNAVIRRSRSAGDQTTARAGTISVLVSATIFAIFHLYEARNLTMLLVLGVDILIFGLIAGAIATRTSRLGPSIVMHIATNALSTVILLSSYPR